MQKSQNIFLSLIYGIFFYIGKAVTAALGLLFLKKIDTMPKKYPFAQEMFEAGPERFLQKPTGIKIGRALFHPLLFLFSQKKYDKNS